MNTRHGRGMLRAVLAMVAMLAAGVTARGDETSPGIDHSGAYFKNDKGQEWEVKQPLASNKDQDWMFLRFGDFTGYKPRIAVMVAGNQQPGVNYWEWSDGINSYKVPISEYNVGLGAPVHDIESFVTAGFKNTNRYRLFERGQLGHVTDEQKRGMEGTEAPQSAPAAGKVTGVQYLVETTVNEWKADKNKSDTRAGRLGMSSLTGGVFGRSKAEVAMSFKIIDATTSELVDTRVVRATCDNWKIGAGGLFFGESSILGGLTQIEKTSPASYAVQSCVNKAIYEIVSTLKARPWSGIVMDAREGDIYVNAGADAGLKVGMQLTAIKKGVDMTNPETGQVIHTHGKEIGTLDITEVNDDYTVARPKSDCKGVAKGDVVKIKS